MDNLKDVMANYSIKIKEFVDTKLPNIIGSEAVIMYKENFYNESFFGKKWEDVQRRVGGTRMVWNKKGKGRIVNVPPKKGADGKRKILTGTGNLGRSIRYKVVNRTVIIYSDVIYSAVHNEGLTAGKSGFQMPQRQFLGDSPEIRKMIKTVLINGIKGICKNG